MSSTPVFITGLGAVSAAGTGCAATLESFRNGNGNPCTAAREETPIAKPVFTVGDPAAIANAEEMRTLRLATLAVDEALSDARFRKRPSDIRVGVCLGTTVACQLNDIDFYRELRASGQASAVVFDRYLRGNLSAAVAERYGFCGPTLTITNACSSGTDAIGMALAWLRAGLCEAAIAGGADELSRIPMAGFNALGIMSATACAPFDRDRQGLNLGEGAGILLLETDAGVARRDAPAVLTCEGYGTFGDAHHLTAPREDGSGLEAAIRGALTTAGCAPDDIGFINAHGTATATNDAIEGTVLARVFGTDCVLSATKGYTGHTLGAAGGVEAGFTALGLREGWIPASAGYKNRDTSIPVAPVTRMTNVTGRYALSTSLAFGGNNSALVLGRQP